MTGTPDYTFSLGGNISKAVANNEDLLGVYMAAMAKYALENSAVAKDEKKVNLEATKMMLAYCEDEKNNVKLNKTLKKMIEANKEGKLESML
jgi:tellurite resistance protein